ncbi:hypothetical protein FRC08_017472 [Ceratobasidium sp. 394]|nr:hypothetical protein FRC08_017472 [Ceratobasidium sp. 394]KAG9101013.1 hypothetical protein FS749_011096 [Ceratobasidium sp. UAMH 11750]
MSDARSLLRRAKAAESEKRINHPLALYNSSGQLRCAACGTTIKPHAWEGHVGSKAHRTQAARLRAEEEKERARKRKVAEEVEVVEVEEDAEGKRRRVDEPEPVAAVPQTTTGGFPADFFSDPSRAPPVMGAEEDDDDADESMPPPSATNPLSLDDEFAAFSKAVLQPALKSTSADVYEQATTMAEPELFNNTADGFPASVTGAAADGDGAQEEPEEETEAQKRQRLEQEERELIMDRLRDEELAQEEADDRVARLKARLEAVRLERMQKPGGAGDTPMASASGSGTDKKMLLKILRGKKKAPPAP